MNRSCGRLLSSGFTLIELIIAIAMITVLTLATVVSFDRRGVDIDVAARILQNNIELAQDLAMTHGSAYGFRSLSTTSYEIYEGVPGTPARNPLTNQNLIVNISPVTFQGVVPSVEFQASGQPTIVADSSIIMTYGSRTKTIVVRKNTGHTDLQ